MVTVEKIYHKDDNIWQVHVELENGFHHDLYFEDDVDIEDPVNLTFFEEEALFLGTVRAEVGRFTPKSLEETRVND